MLSLRNYPKIHKGIDILFISIGVLYPFALFFVETKEILFAFMAFICALKIFFVESLAQRVANTCLFLLFVVYFLIKLELLVYLYPIFINVFLFCLFFGSLSKEAIITKVARKAAKLKGEILEQKAVIYTRNLTKIWCVFFVCNALVALFLSFLDNKIYWVMYCGVISYVLIGVLFGGEILYRKFILKVDSAKL